MAYADYAFYKDRFFGNAISEEDFPRLAERASEYMDMLTFGRGAAYHDEKDLLKKACCAIADAYQNNEQGGGVVAETVGKVTRNYAAGVSNTPTEGWRLYIAAERYLLGTGLLYLGGGGL